MEKKNKNPIYFIANKIEYKNYLKLKLKEEIKEFLEDESIEELSDVYEVLKNLQKELNYTDEKILKNINEKNKKKGSFKKRIILIFK